MAILNIMDTKIPQNYSSALFNERSYEFSAEHTDKVLEVLISGTSNYLGAIKSKDYPVALVIKENNGDLIAAAVVEYHKNEDDDKTPGSWSYIWTFSNDDIPEGSRVIDITDINTASFYREIAANKYSFGFRTEECRVEMTKYMFRILRNWLDENAVEGEENGVKVDGVVTTRVFVEDGEIVKTMEPVGDVKVLIKGDSTIEA